MVETADDARIYYEIFIARILLIVPYTVLVYEYLLTLEREVSGWWGGTRLTWGTFFFFVNRYSPLVGTIPIIVQYYSTTTDPAKMPMCHALRAYHQYFALLSQALVAVMLIMRTFALYERNKAVLAFTILVTLASFFFAVAIFLTGNAEGTLSPQLAAFGCPVATAHGKSIRLGEAWSGMLVFDSTVFGLTLYKALKLNVRHSGELLATLFRDGCVYFALMIISNACNIATYTMSGPFLRGSATTVTNVTSSIMISRLMFNLRTPSRTRLPMSRTSRRTPSALSRAGAGSSANFHFTTVAGAGYTDPHLYSPYEHEEAAAGTRWDSAEHALQGPSRDAYDASLEPGVR